MLNRKQSYVLLMPVWLAALMMLDGCSSTKKSGSTGFASVVIRGNTPGQISEMAAEVFEEHGYKVSRTGMHRLIFDKEGGTMNNVLYGNWLGSDVWTRVKASIEPVGEATFRLECQAYILRDRGGTTEEEVKMTAVRSGPYQKILDEVAKRLSAPAAP